MLLGLFIIPLYLIWLLSGEKSLLRIIKIILIQYVIWLIYLYNLSIEDIYILDSIIIIKKENLLFTIWFILIFLLGTTHFSFLLPFLHNSFNLKSARLLILLILLIGLIGIIESQDLILSLINLELINICIYILVINNVSGLKYFIINSIATLFFLLGIIFIYFKYGVTNYLLLEILNSYSTITLIDQYILFFFFLCFFIKLGLIPFHNWLINIVDNLNYTNNIIINIFSKFSIFYLIKSLLFILPLNSDFLYYLDYLLKFNIILGPILLFSQFTLKRFLAISSISTISLLLYVLIFIGPTINLFNYLFIYFFTLFLIFLTLDSYSNTHPYYYILLLIAILSLIGIPPLPGFYIKLNILTEILLNDHILLVILFLISSLILTVNYFSFLFHLTHNILFTNTTYQIFPLIFIIIFLSSSYFLYPIFV